MRSALKKNDLSLSSSFEAKGQWWLPDTPDNRVGGTLSYTPTAINLNLHGALSPVSFRDFATVQDDFDRFPLIHGDTDVGKVTLFNSSVRSLEHNLTETIQSAFSAIWLLLGNHVEDDSIRSDSVSFSCSHLDEFFVPQSFATENVGRGVTVRYDPPEPLVLDLPSESLQVSFEQDLLCSDSRTRISLTARRKIIITPSSPKPFLWHLERVWRMCHLLSLLSDEAVRPQRIEVTVEGDSSPHLLFYRTSGSQIEDRRPSSLLLFYYGHIIEQLGDIVNQWFSAPPTLTTAVHLFMDGQRQNDSSEGRFLTLCQAFEAFSRATTESDYMPSTHYESVKKQIIAAIPSTVASDHKESLKSRIRYGNEYSLRKRLTKAVESLPDDAIECVCKSIGEFVSGLVDTRNYLTHYTDELRENALRGADLFWASERLAMLLRILLLREFGIDMALIVERISGHPRLLQYRHQYHKHPEKA